MHNPVLETRFVMDIIDRLASTFKANPVRTKAIDTFMGFLVLLGALQFVFCVLVGNFPFNAFLGGFSSTVGQFVLLAALRIQLDPGNRHEFKQSPQRAFADFVGGSLILHFLVYHFIN